MSYFRMGHFALRQLRRTMRWVAVLVMSCSLISTGGLLWVNNSWAVLPDDDPATFFDSSIVFDALNGEVDCDDLDPDGDGRIPLTGGKLVRGNGDQDDNRTEPWRIVCRPGAMMAPAPFCASVVFWEHRVVTSYLDFGHLKVFPDIAVLSLIITEKVTPDNLKAATLYPCGGLFCWAAPRSLPGKERGLIYAQFTSG